MISLRTTVLSVDNARTLIALPDTETQFEQSRARGGVGRQINHWWLYQLRPEPAVIKTDFIRYVQYEDRKNELEALRTAGCDIILGATVSDFQHALDGHLRGEFYLCLFAHFDVAKGAFEFTDDFLYVDDLCKTAPRDAVGILDLISCRASRIKGEIKASLPSVWIITSDVALTTAGWLLFRSHFLRSMLRRPGTYEELWCRTANILRMLSSPGQPPSSEHL